jgi:membrane protein implicated in regulation of membrane protease activity
MTVMQHVAEDAGTIGNSSASAVIAGVSVAGIGLPDWVAIISGVYFLISTVFLVMKVAAWRKDRNAKTKTTGDGAD